MSTVSTSTTARALLAATVTATLLFGLPLAGSASPVQDPPSDQAPGGAPTASTPTTTSPTTTSPTTTSPTTTSPTTTTVGTFDDPSTTTSEVPRAQLIPPPIDLTSLDQLLMTRQAEAAAAAKAVADAANAESMSSVATARAAVEALRAELPAATGAVTAARAEESRAAAALDASRSLIGDLAVESYQIATSGRAPVAAGQTAVMQSMDGFEEYVRTTAYSEAAWHSVDATISRAEETRLAAAQKRRDALKNEQALKDRISVAGRSLDTAESSAAEVAAKGAEAIDVARATGEDLKSGPLGPTIMGESIVGADDMAAFVAQRGNGVPTAELRELTGYFESEGRAEGVRGDLALAQSILETGNFGFKGSMVARTDHNYAGIGACDSCSSGFRYDTPELGVRAQMQLLRTYAQPGLRTTDLAHPPVGKPPEKSGVRGCCSTWMELSGVWATGAGYGVKILTIYNQMLAFAAQRQRSAALLAAASPPSSQVPQPAPVPPSAPPGG